MTSLEVYYWDNERWVPIFSDNYYCRQNGENEAKRQCLRDAVAIHNFLSESSHFACNNFRIVTNDFDMTTQKSEGFDDDNEDQEFLCPA